VETNLISGTFISLQKADQSVCDNRMVVIRAVGVTKALLVTVLLCASCGGSSPPPIEAAASVVAAEEASDSLGFDVGRHGWAFGNYAASESGQFSVADAVTLFGDAAVCVESEGACTPTPAAAEWIEMVASSMQYGVCEGMTVASVDRFLVGANPETALLALTSEVEHRLARLFATQFLDDVITATEQWRTRSVAAIVAELQASLVDPSAEQYTLGVYSKVGGHSVLPYAVDLDDQGRGVVYVYDPNWPGEQRYIEVDTQANRWRFSYFAADQSNDPEAWTGGSGLMDLTPLSVREAPFPEPFKGSGTGAKQLLAISSTTRNWTLTRAGGVLDGESAVPGRDGVIAVTRGAPLDRGSQRTDVVLVEWAENAELAIEDGAAKLSVFTDAGAGSVVVSNEATIKVEAPSDPDPVKELTGLKIEVDVAEETEATVTIASTTERVQIAAQPDLRTSVQLAEVSTKIEIVDDQSETVKVVEIPRNDKRIDVIVDADGDVDTYIPKSIPVEERLDAIEKSSELLVADDVKSRTVEVSSTIADKIEVKDLRVDTVDKTQTTTTLEERSKVSVDSKDNQEKTIAIDIAESDVTEIRIDETGDSGTLLLADGSKVEVRISSNGDIVTSDGRTVDVTIKPRNEKPKKETDTTNPDERKKQETTKSDDEEAQRKKDAPSDKEITERKKEETTKSDDSLDKKDESNKDEELREKKDEATDAKKDEATKSDDDEAQRKKDESNKDEELRDKREEATDAKKETSERKQDESLKSDDRTSDFKLDDNKSDTSKADDSASFDTKTDDRASDFKLDDNKR